MPADLSTDPRLDVAADPDPRDSEFPIPATPVYRKLQQAWQAPHLFTQTGGGAVAHAIGHHLLARPHGRHLREVTELLDSEALPPGISLRDGLRRTVKLGHYLSYHWARTEQQVADAVTNLGPMLLACTWTEDLHQPTLTGLIGPTGEALGVNCVLISAINSRAGLYRIGTAFGPRWGLRGNAYLSREAMADLLAMPGSLACLPIKTRQQ